ncbi:MAG: DUF1553 domain-containing protein, partial [Planctomycetaceae bacterium]
SIALQSGESIEDLGAVSPNEWQNLQLVVDLKGRTLSGSLGTPKSVTNFTNEPCSPAWFGSIDLVVFDSHGSPDSQRPAIEYDNLGVQVAPIAPVSTEPPPLQERVIDYVALTGELEQLTGFDGDFELQTEDSPPASPWGPGPNSVVRMSSSSQSPFVNVYPAGEVGISLPNRGEYDGFGRPLTNVEANDDGQLFVSFDFRCANDAAGGDGSWRYYLGHGPGNSAAIELFFNGHEFFRRSADNRDAVCPLTVGEWHQVQLTLNLNTKSYVGLLASSDSQVEFSGEFAAGWDGTIDYTFIDSYGHIGGVRPALDADNFVLSSARLPEFGSEPVEASPLDRDARLARVAEIRQQLSAHSPGDELKKLLEDGPCAMAYGVTEGTPHNVRMQMRGEPDQPGDEIPRGFIKVLGGNPLGPEVTGSGRLELAQWLTSPENPLTARVMMNRIWQYHFGKGLVNTPNDFGVRGIPPTHPEMLDYLATQFIQSGWSVKAMHRMIMLSATYQESSVAEMPQGTGMDDLYIRFPRRRLSAEEIRDTILTVSGELDATPAEGHPFPTPTSWGYTQHGPFSAVYDHNKRSVYLMTQRLKRHPFLALFDGADPNTSTPARLGTTVPTQALFFLNDPFVHEKAEKWAARLQTNGNNESDWIEQAWTHAFGRSPTQTERDEAIAFLADYRAELLASGMDNVDQRSLAALLRTLIGSNEFLHVD